MRTIRRNKKYESLVDLMTKHKHSKADTTIFPTIRDLLCFLAVLGFENSSRYSLGNDTAELDGRVFSSHQQSLDILYLLALSEKRDISVLRDENEEELITIFEEYIEGGFQVLERWVSQTGDEEGDASILKGIEECLKKVGADITPDSISF